MNDIWSIIGLSSLIASIVSVTLGYFVEKYRFKREKETGYVQAQIQLYSQFHFLLQRFLKESLDWRPLGGISIEKELGELNNIIKTKSDLLEPIVKNKWIDIMALLREFMLKGTSKEKSKKLYFKIQEDIKQLDNNIKDISNNNLIPKYRKIVGETVPALK